MTRGQRLRRWLDAHRPVLVALLVVGSVYAACYVWTVHNKQLFAPDTRYYAAMSLWYGGGDQHDIARQIADYSARFGWASPGPDQLFGWGLVQPRVVLPALSVPFVKLWGIEGMAVVPGIALALLVALLTVMLTRRYGAGAAIASMLLVVCSTQVVFFGAAMLTEGLSALWTALTLLVAWHYLKRPNRRDIALMVLLTLLSAFTRQATLIVAGAFVMAWLLGRLLRRPEPWGWPALAVLVSSIGAQVLQSRLFPTFSQTNQFLAKTGADSLGEAILKSPHLMWEILRWDFQYAVASDRAQLALVGLSLISMLLLWRRSESHLLLGALLAAGLYNVTNGTPVGIRYAMPGLVFFAVSVAALIAWAQPVAAAEAEAVPDPEPPAETLDAAPEPAPEPAPEDEPSEATLA